MLVKFRPSSTQSGTYGLVNAIKAAATAAAGTTPSKPSYVEDWEVVSNTVAGGWTEISTNLGSSGEQLVIAAPTPKTATVAPNEYKFWRIYRSTASANYGATYCSAGRWEGNISTGSGTQTDTQHLTYNTSTSTSPYYRMWQGDYASLSSNSFYIAVTAEYLWVWKEKNSATDYDDRHMIGVSDLTAGTVWDYSAGSKHFPVGGCYTFTTDTSTDNQYTNYRTQAYGIKNQNESYSKYFNELISWGQYISCNTGTSVDNNYVMPIAPAYITTTAAPTSTSIGTNKYYKSSWDLTAFDRTTINDIVFSSPLNGWNSRKLKGAAFVGWNRYNSSYDTRQLHNKIVSVGSDSWLLLEIGKCLWALKVA